MSLTNSRMQPLISMYQANRLDKWEILFSQYGVYGSFLNETDRPGGILSPENKKNLYNSWGNTVPIVTLVGDTVTIGDTYSCTIADQENTSNKYTPTFTQYAWGWNMYPAQYRTGEQAMNYVKYQQDFDHKANEFLLALMTLVDTASRNILETNKNIYWTTNVANYYPTTGNALQISQAQKNDSFNQLAAVMKEMDLYENCLLIASTSLTPLTRRLESQGEGNAINERFQFLLGNFTFSASNRVTNGAGIQATAYMCQPGSIAVFNRNNPDARMHNKIGGGTNPVAEWNELMLPRLEMVVGTYYATTCSSAPDATNYLSPNLSATMKESFGFNTEIGWITAAQGNSNTSTKVVPIVKAEWAN